MEKKNIVIVIPGFEYDSNGPVYIDKIKIEASVNGEPIDVFTHGFTSSKGVNTLNAWDDVSPNNIIYNQALFSNQEDDNIRNYWAGSSNPEEIDLSISSQIIPYSKTLLEDPTPKVPYSFFNDILEIKDGVYHHYLTVYNSSSIQTRQNDYKEHDGICWLALDEINTDIIFNITFYSFVGEDNNYKTDNNYVIVGQKTMYYNPATSGYEGGQVDFCGLSFQQYYDITDQTKGYTVELEDPIVYEDVDGVKKIYKYESTGYTQTQQVLDDDLCISIYPQWAISDGKNSVKTKTVDIRRQHIDHTDYDFYYLSGTNGKNTEFNPAPNQDSFTIYTTANLQKSTIIPLVFKKDRPGWTSFSDGPTITALNYQKNYFNDLTNGTGLPTTDLIKKGILKSNITFNSSESGGSLSQTPFDFGTSNWINLTSLRNAQFNNLDVKDTNYGHDYMGLESVDSNVYTTRLKRPAGNYSWPFDQYNERGKYYLIKDSQLVVGYGEKEYNYTIIKDNSNLYNSTYIYKKQVSVVVKNLSNTQSYIIQPQGYSGDAQVIIYINNQTINKPKPCKKQDHYYYSFPQYMGRYTTYVYPIKQEDIISNETIIEPNQFAAKLSNMGIKLNATYGVLNPSTQGSVWLPNVLFAVDLSRSKLSFDQSSAYRIKPQYVYSINGIFKGIYGKDSGKEILVNSNVDTTINYLTDQDDSNLEWLVGQDQLKTPIDMGYNCSYYNEKDFVELKYYNEFNINKTIQLDSGFYILNYNLYIDDSTVSKVNYRFNYSIQGESSSHDIYKSYIGFWLKNKSTVTINYLRVELINRSDKQARGYIRNIGLYQVPLDSDSLYTTLLNNEIQDFKKQYSEARSGSTANSKLEQAVKNYVIFPSCYTYKENHKCFENSYNFTWLPDKPMYKIEDSYTLNNDYKDKVSNVATQSLDAFGSPITIRE